ncbi:MAG: SDR family NAD(P)-dependent oxidoreductase [Burkholderiaceae bacterium]|nr:SDR family NAD(P)-dependent oxidoreductase [Burkholderiaceae bacterium]
MKQEVAVIAGVGAGLGWALAKRFSRAGMRVAAVARDVDKLKELADAEGSADIRLERCDVAHPAEVARFFERVEKELGVPGIVVFNAGAYERGGILESEPETFERCWRIGCFGSFLVGQAAARLMVSKRAGTILFTGATASLRGSAGFINLAAPKFGLRAVAQSMARELGPQGIHVAHVILDGQIDSDRDHRLLREQAEPSMLPPDDIAEAYYQLHRQSRGAWTHELDLRPWSEKF